MKTKTFKTTFPDDLDSLIAQFFEEHPDIIVKDIKFACEQSLAAMIIYQDAKFNA